MSYLGQHYFGLKKLIIASAAVIVMFSSCNYFNSDQSKATIFIDLESEPDEKNRYFVDFENSTVDLSVGGTRTTEKSYSGDFSLLMKDNQLYGLSKRYKNMGDYRHIRVSVWRWDPSGGSTLVLQGEKGSNFYKPISTPEEKRADGWEKLVLDVFPPHHIKNYSIFVWKNQADSVYFDDFKIEFNRDLPYPKYTNEEKLHLYFSEKDMVRFRKKIESAYDLGIHFSDGKWLKGVLSDEDQVMPIKARLKGDWLDHLEGEKFSLRIKMRKDFVFKRMKVFSIQHPETRSFLNEYVSHLVVKDQDLLTTRYGFVPVYRNGNSLGLYAWEEHFSKQLIEFNRRREGPIVKFDEDPFWIQNLQYKLKNDVGGLTYYQTSRVLSFGMNKVLQNSKLKNNFDIAQGLMYQLKYATAPADELLDVDKTAKFWALIDVINGKHGTAWHNQRFYYNPVLCKLEPISFDNFTDHHGHGPPAKMSPLAFDMNKPVTNTDVINQYIFCSQPLLDAYVNYVENYTKPAFLDSFFVAHDQAIIKQKNLLDMEFSNIDYDQMFFYDNQKQIKSQLDELKLKRSNGYFNKYTSEVILKSANPKLDSKFTPYYINAFYSTEDSLQALLQVENFTGNHIRLIGLATDKGKPLRLFPEGMVLDPFKGTLQDTVFSAEFDEKAVKLLYMTDTSDEILVVELSPWRKYAGQSPYQIIKQSFNLETCDLFEHRGDSLIVSGDKLVDSKVLIPDGKVVVFKAGSRIDMVNEAAIISHSPLFFNGSIENPIQVNSSDSSSNGIVVLQASGRSEVNHVVFDGLNTLSYLGWTLTGAVNFYESEVVIDHCVFSNNRCEDALNIIRSDFLVANCRFENIKSDAFDSDFCTGRLEKTLFTQVGNDAIDFSTSEISITRCEMSQIGDKGISGGEASTLEVSDCLITDCNIGVASKDLSLVKLENIQINLCNYGLVALQKKPEYGSAQIFARKITFDQIQKKHLIEVGSSLQLNGRKIEGSIKKASQLFY